MISVIVAIYNVQEYLRECIESICNQTFQKLEIILVDDGSKDDSPKICDEFALKDNRIKVIHQSNKGVSGARNTGVRNANGEYIAFVDADDILHPYMFEFLYSAIREVNADISICRENSFTTECQWEDYERYHIESIEKRDQLLRHFMDEFTGPINWAWNKLYKADLVKNIEFCEGYSLEDIRFSTDSLQKVKKAVWISERLYGYRQRANSTMNSKKDKVYKDFADALKYQLDSVSVMENEKYKLEYKRYYIRKMARLKAQAYQDKKEEAYKYISDRICEMDKADIKCLKFKEKVIYKMAKKKGFYDKHAKVNEI